MGAITLDEIKQSRIVWIKIEQLQSDSQFAYLIS